MSALCNVRKGNLVWMATVYNAWNHAPHVFHKLNVQVAYMDMAMHLWGTVYLTAHWGITQNPWSA